MFLIQQKLSSWFQTNKPGGQLYSDASPDEVSEYSLLPHGDCSLDRVTNVFFVFFKCLDVPYKIPLFAQR